MVTAHSYLELKDLFLNVYQNPVFKIPYNLFFLATDKSPGYNTDQNGGNRSNSYCCHVFFLM